MIRIFKKKDRIKPKDESFELIKQLVIKILGNDAQQVALTPDTKFEDIGFDSIKFINLLLSLEDIIDVDLETIVAETDPSSIITINDVVQLLNRLKRQ